jgi:hypothetical protein
MSRIDTAGLESLSRSMARVRTGGLPGQIRTNGCCSCPPDAPPGIQQWFQGDRTRCRDLPYAFSLGEVPFGETVTVSSSALVTMCPTRIIAISEGGAETVITEIKFGNQPQLAGSEIPTDMLSPFAYQAVPLVSSCFCAGLPISVSVRNDSADTAYEVVIIFSGPTEG